MSSLVIPVVQGGGGGEGGVKLDSLNHRFAYLINDIRVCHDIIDEACTASWPAATRCGVGYHGSTAVCCMSVARAMACPTSEYTHERECLPTHPNTVMTSILALLQPYPSFSEISLLNGPKVI